MNAKLPISVDSFQPVAASIGNVPSHVSHFIKTESCTEISTAISSFSYLNGERVCRMHFYAKTRDFRVEIAFTACAIASSSKGMFLACLMFAVSCKPAFVAEIDK